MIQRNLGALRCGLTLASLLSGALFLAAGCRQPAAPPPPPAAEAAQKEFFAGDEACESCHPNSFLDHQNSHHAHSLRVADAENLGKLAPPVGRISGTEYAIVKEGSLYYFANWKNPSERRKLDLALGSGKLGITYVSFMDEKSLMELRMSYFPGQNIWYITPGQEEMFDNHLGFVHNEKLARQCMGCHTITVPQQKTRPEERFFGIGCESCHGPAGAHAERMKAAVAQGKPLYDPHISKLGRLKASKLMEICGKCHRSPNAVGTSGLEISMTQRFQVYGLMQSPCYQKSGDTLSCLTCHDPHKNASKDHKDYESACLSCHGGKPTGMEPTPAVPSKPCPVNPRDKCIGCHMPTRKVFPGSKVPISMADHLIWAYGKKRKPLSEQP